MPNVKRVLELCSAIPVARGAGDDPALVSVGGAFLAFGTSGHF
jgi:hypothetical protein